MRATLAGVALFALVLAGCGGDDKPEEPAADPYEVYLDNAPSGEPTLSREDAQARAFLGCGMKFAPGTVDAVLRDAYKPDCPEE